MDTDLRKTQDTEDSETLPYPEDQPLLPVWPIVGKAIGCGRSQTFKLITDGEFPVETLKYGSRFFARTADVRSYLRLPLTRPKAS